MVLTDYHTHSNCSSDGHVPIAEMARAAKSAGLGELCITDHCDLLSGSGARRLTYDWSPVLEQYAAARQLEEAGFSLRLGLELGGAQVSPSHAEAILAGAELDFVIGSVHNKSEALGGGDFYYVDYTSPRLCHEMLADYFESLLAVARLGLYDSLGHIIYPLRYMNLRDGQGVTLEPHLPVIREILAAVLAADRSLEVNTYCGRTVEDWRQVLTLYHEMGGHRVTLGSDAHRPGDVGKGLSQACALLRELGYREITVYHRRRPQSIAL
jgi:histidinol-phosphatase (PHP family)